MYVNRFEKDNERVMLIAMMLLFVILIVLGIRTVRIFKYFEPETV